MAMNCCSVFQGGPNPKFLYPIPLTDPVCIFSRHPLGSYGATQGASTKGLPWLGCPMSGRQGRRAMHWITRPHPTVQGRESSSNC